MKRSIIVLTILFALPLLSAAQQLTEGAALLFKGVKSATTVADKNLIYKKLGFALSKNKKEFVDASDAAKEYPFGVTVSPTDMNNDGKEEVFVSFGNSFTSGGAGSSIILFIKDAANNYNANLGFPGTADIMPTSNNGYPDLVIGGPGMSFPVLRWKGTEYDNYKTITNSQLEKTKTRSPEEVSRAYQAKIK